MDSKEWNGILAGLSQPHLLQTWQWGEAKRAFGWSPHYKTWQDISGKVIAAAQILERTVRLPIIGTQMKMLYIPKGPILSDWEDTKLRLRVLSDLKTFAEEQGAFFIKVDPDVSFAHGLPGEESEQLFKESKSFVDQLKKQGWRYSNEQVQMPNTMHIDLSETEEDLLSSMKQKTRYNVRLGQRKGLSVRVGDPEDFDRLYKMYAETAVRDGFVIRNREYYLTVWQTFFDAGLLKPLIADVDGKSIAGLMLFIFQKQAWYIYGMSTSLHRNTMPNYGLQWEAIRVAKAAGCEIYDLWGAPDNFNESDPMWGVYRFKKGLAAYEVRTIGAWDLPIHPFIYRLYTQVLPRIIALMRFRGRRQTREQLETGFDS